MTQADDSRSLLTRIEQLERDLAELRQRVATVETSKRDKRASMLTPARVPRSPAGGSGPR